MFTNYLKIACRTLWRNRVYSAINIVSLAVGIAAMTLVFLIVDLLFVNFDRFHANADRLYVLRQESANMRANASSVAPALPILLRNYPAIENGTRLLFRETNWIAYRDRDVRKTVMHVDTGFFNVLTFPLRLGDARTALSYRTGLILSQPTADALFGSENPMGKLVRIDSNRTGVVRGVLMPIPKNSSYQPDVIAPVADLEARNPGTVSNWYNGDCTTILLLRPDASIAALTKQLPAFVRQYYDPNAQDRRLSLLRYDQLFGTQAGAIFTVMKVGNATLILFVLLIVSINFLTISTAVSLARSAEVALKTAIGASRWQVATPFLLEAGIVAGLGSLGGLGLLQAVFPRFVGYFEIGNLLDPNAVFSMAVAGHVIGWLLGIILVETLLAGLYPAWFLTKQKVVTALQGKATTTVTKMPLRNGLLVVQFTLATVMIAGALIMPVQNRYLRGRDMGFDLSSLYAVELRDFRNPAVAAAQINVLSNRLSDNPNVVSHSLTNQLMGDYGNSQNSFASEGSDQKTLMAQMTVDADFLKTYGVQLVAGRGFTGGIADSQNRAVLINQTALKALGWSSIAGRRLTANDGVFPVVGVVRDFNYRISPQAGQKPLILFNDNQPNVRGGLYLVMNLRPGQEKRVLADVLTSVRQLPTRRALRAYALSDEFDKQYWIVDKSQAYMGWMSGVTVLLACAGLFGMSVFTARQRTKEIGIRKVLGASVAGVLLLLTRSVLKWVTVAVLIALPMAWWVMNQWLQAFPYHIAFPWWLLIRSGVGAILVALLTVSFQSIKAALMNPVKSLRSD